MEPNSSASQQLRVNGPTNDVDRVIADGDGVTFVKAGPYQFTKSTAFSGLTWKVTGKVSGNTPYVGLIYQMAYNHSRSVGAHNQEIPAIFTDESIGYWYYFYRDNEPYSSVDSSVTRLRSDFGTELKLPGREEPFPQPPPATYFEATEEWLTTCDRLEEQCLTLASFAPEVKVLTLGNQLSGAGQYVTALGRFALGADYNSTWGIYLFPYRYDDIVDGRSIRQWIYDLNPGYS